jgi:malonyl-CoA O-methyltransferase
MIAQALAHTHSKQALNKKPALLPINGAPQKRALIQSAEQPRGIVRNRRWANDKFSKAAEQYNSHANVQKQAARDLFKWINSQPYNQNKRCVDLGAGPLVNTSQLSKQYGQVIAIDLSLNMLKSAALTNPKVCADMDNLPLQASSIDVIFSNFAVQWSANFEKLMHSLYKSLKPGGQAYISTVVAGSLNEIKTAFAALDNRSHINTFNTHAYINRSVQKAGFSISADFVNNPWRELA